MRIQLLAIIAIIALVLVGCSKTAMPYKSLSDTRPSTPTGNVVGVHKEVVNAPAKTETAAKTEIASAPSCKDSDYGKNIDSAGVVSGISEDGSQYEMRDACLDDNIFEYYCDGVKAKVMQDKCPRGCKNGFCV